MQMTTLLNRTDGIPDELALIRSEPLSMQWTNELRRNIGLHPSCRLLRELLSLDVYTRTIVYPFLIKGWSSRRIADRQFPAFQSCLKLSGSHRLTKIVVRSYGNTLFPLALHGIRGHGNDVNRRVPWTGIL